jgi:hypothetical protein
MILLNDIGWKKNPTKMKVTGLEKT